MTDPTPDATSTPSLPQRLRSAPDLDAFMEVFDGDLPREEDPLMYLEDYLKAAATWCDDHGAPASAAKLREWLPVIEEMSDDLFTLTDEAQTEMRKAAMPSGPQPAVRELRVTAALTRSPGATSAPRLPATPAAGAPEAAAPQRAHRL
ncbi:hypothetical protein E6W39_06610 [Kitasatospora acidiphila]|uniref:Uncharacterized protein n=1 Tax=Kitasatospora acidiphila TaxID=2567942 RepID=A0A540VZ12_9ACTN|nr:hypothetical protein [Kitasatospora acidiphila]TQF02009.1 hypothetical protein E6W39_06610 [Kitasatospora acidiphila]